MGFFAKLTVYLLALLSASCATLTDSLIYAVFYLILSFCSTTFALLFLGFEFFGLILLLIYVGAVAVLFVFVVMMIPTRIDQELSNNLFKFYS